MEKEQLEIDEIFEFFCSYVNEQKDLINRDNANLEYIYTKWNHDSRHKK